MAKRRRSLTQRSRQGKVGGMALSALVSALIFGTSVAWPSLAASPAKILRAGACAVDITPPKLPVLVNGGMTERKSSEVTDRLHCRALVLDDGTVRLAIAVVDSCVVPRPILEKAKSLAEQATGIPVGHILVSATHCHSAPSVCGALGTGVDEDYAKFLPGKIAEAIAGAQKNLAPARIGWAVGRDPKNVFCRRFLMKPGTAPTNPFSGTKNDQAMMNPGYQNPNAVRRTGPVDDSVSVISVQAKCGRPIAVLGNYSTHYAGAPGISADYFGVFCRRIGELVGARKGQPAFVGLMTNGTSGDANCCDFVHPPRKFDRFTVGEDVAQAAFAALKTIRYYDWVPLAVEEKLLTLHVRMPSAKEVADAKEFLAKANLPDGRPRTVPQVYARETILMSELPPTRQLKLQAMRIGGLGIAAFPNEVFGSTGLAVKKKSPLKPTINIELANGYFGYLPPPEQFPLGGYTTWRARSSCLEVNAEPKIAATALELLNRVAAARAGEEPIASPSVTTMIYSVPLLTTQDAASGELAGWKFFAEDPNAKPGDVWKLGSDGVLCCRGKPKGYLATQKDYTDFTLRLEWRWPKGRPGNGGVLLRMTGPDRIWPKSLEAQINAGEAGDFWGLNGFAVSGPADRSKSLTHPQFGKLTNVKKTIGMEKPAGQWNQYEIVVRGSTIVLSINGREVNRTTRCEVVRGRICLTAEGDPYFFRKVELIPGDR